MTYVFRHVVPLTLVALLPACAEFENPFSGPGSQAEPAPVVVEGPGDPLPLPSADPVVTEPLVAEPSAPVVVEPGAAGASAEALDTTSAEERAEATQVEKPASGLLGETVATLGDPTQQGFWMKTPLVTSETQGTVETEGGAVVQVTLIPLGGEASGGSQLSLAAMRALGLGLTDLPTVKVFSS